MKMEILIQDNLLKIKGMEWVRYNFQMVRYILESLKMIKYMEKDK